MKKSLFLLFASFSFIAANAQTITSKKGEAYLPEKGDWAIGFNPSGLFNWVGNLANGKTNNVAPQVDATTNVASTEIDGIVFVGKKFVTDKNAIRVIAGLTLSREVTKTDDVSFDEDGDRQVDNVNTQIDSRYSLVAGLGKEWRRGKTRLQGYYGADVYLRVDASRFSEKNSDPEEVGAGFEKNVDIDPTRFGLGANGFIGVEYFLFPKMAIGAQYDAGLYIGLTGRGKNKFTDVDGDTTTTPGDERGNSFNLGNVSVGSIRLTLHF